MGATQVRHNGNQQLRKQRPQMMDRLNGSTIHKDINDYHNRASSLAMALYYHLPRELRNRVYTFCVQGLYDNEVIIRRPAHANGPIRFLVRDRTGPHSYQWIDDPINSIIKGSILGDLVAREMLEAYYWTRRFKSSHRELPTLDKVLEKDIFGLGITPACYVRHLHIQLRIGSATYSTLPAAVDSDEEDNLRAIQNLAVVLTTRTELTLEISSFGDVDGNDESPISSLNTEKMLITLVPTINMLKERQLRVAVTHRRLWND